jgi:hypothetical protein
MGQSPLNRLVAGSIPAASTIYPIQYQSFTKRSSRAEGSSRLLCRCVYRCLFGYVGHSLDIVQTEVGFPASLAEEAASFPQSGEWLHGHDIFVALNQMGSHFFFEQRYLLYAPLRMEYPHESTCHRVWSARGPCCLRRFRSNHAPISAYRHYGRDWNYHPSVPSKQSQLRPEQVARSGSAAGAIQ